MKRHTLKIHEDEEQKIIFEWAALMESNYPALRLMYHVPNGGKRSITEAKRFKAQGVKAGVPDIALPYPNGKYHGLYIELKAIGGKLSENQKQWLALLSTVGYKAVCCYGAEEAIGAIKTYLNEKRKEMDQ